MGTENQVRPIHPNRPASTPFGAPPSARPFSSSNAAVGSGSSPPSLPPPQPNMPRSSSGPLVGPAATNFHSPPPSTFNSPSLASQPSAASYVAGGNFPRFHTPQLSATPEAPPACASTFGQTPFLSSTSQVSFQPGPYHASPVGLPPQKASSAAPSVLPPNILYAAPRLQTSFVDHSYPSAQVTTPSFPGYTNQQTTMASQVAPPLQPSIASRPSGYFPNPATGQFKPNQGGYVAPSLVATTMQHPGTGPPTSAMYGLAEDFSSLSLGSIPGSVDPGLDAKALPRPLDGDLEPSSISSNFPLNCHSRYLRLTTSALPNSRSLVSKWHLPLGAVVCPLAEAPDGDEVPIVNFGSTSIIRCRRCRTYINPYVSFTDAGRKWRCNICSLLNDVPGDYFSHLDAAGKRMDLNQRPELTKGSVEFVASTEYMARPPMPPVYFFLIDVSALAVRSGMIQVVAETIKSCLDDLPGYPRTQIGFITFDSTIHFYNMKSSLTQPQMMVVSDLEDIFAPLPDDLLVNLSESRTVVDTFLDSLPFMFQDNMNLESAFGPALKAAYMIMSRLGGKLLIFQNTLPSLGVGRLKLRGDDARVYGTDKEHVSRIPEDPFYKQMAADLTKYHIGVNVYAFSDKYTDIASLGTLAKYTGGQVYYYPSFHLASHKEKLRHELARDLTRETAWEAIMRIRCGKGIRFTSYHGNFMLRSSDLVALPTLDCDKAFAMQLALEETLLTTQTVYFQAALVYTASCGERRIRVHTAAASVVTDLGEMYRQADTGAVVSLFSRLATEKTMTHKLEDARMAVQGRIVKALKEYRNLYAVQNRLGGKMIYPESLKFLPLYGLALCKSAALRGGHADVALDERCAVGYTMMALPVKKLLKLLYPNLIRIDEYLLKPSVSTHAVELNSVMKRLALTADSLDSRGLYLFDDGFRFIIWFGRMLSPEISKNLLGQDFATDLSRGENEMSRKLSDLLKKLRESDPSYYQLCHLVRQGEQPREGLLLVNLVEEQIGGSNGYVEWIQQIYRKVHQNA